MPTPTALPSSFQTGDVLTAANMNLLRGAFRVLQVVRATDSTNRSTTSTAFTDANISVSITPAASSNNVLLIWSFFSDLIHASGADNRGLYQITDNSNNAISGAERLAFGGSNQSAQTMQSSIQLIGFHSPASTSAQTYKGRFAVEAATCTNRCLNGTATGQLFALELSA